MYPSCKIFFIVTLCLATIMLNSVDPMTLMMVSSAYFFSFSSGHLAVLLIQLEMLALITAYAIFLAVTGGSPVLFLALLIFTVIAAEGSIGLAFLLKASRQCSPGMEKSGV